MHLSIAWMILINEGELEPIWRWVDDQGKACRSFGARQVDGSYWVHKVLRGGRCLSLMACFKHLRRNWPGWTKKPFESSYFINQASFLSFGKVKFDNYILLHSTFPAVLSASPYYQRLFYCYFSNSSHSHRIILGFHIVCSQWGKISRGDLKFLLQVNAV